MSDRIRIIMHQGHQVLMADNSNLKVEEMLKGLVEVERLAIERRVTLFCTDVTNARATDEIKTATTAMLGRIKAKVGDIHSALVGLTGIQKILANAVVRGQYFASTREEALDWLVKQAGK